MNEQSSIDILLAETKRYLDLRMRQLKFLSVEKLSYVLAAVTLIAIVAIFGIVSACYFSLSFVHLLRIYVGTTGAYAIMGAVALLIIVLFYLQRKRWLLNPITRILARAMLDENDDTP